MSGYIIRFFISFCFVFVGVSDGEADNLSAAMILKKTDEVRRPIKDYRVTARIISKRPGKKDRTAIYEVLLKGDDKTIIKTLAPEMDRGTSLLMLKYDLWVFMTTISKPLRISMQQRLFGEAANGDIARVNFSGDYEPVLEDIVMINGKKFYLLELKAKSEKVTYNRIKLWVMKETFFPLKAQFFAFSGKMLKTCYYTNYKEILGRVRPTRLVLDNPLIDGQRSIIDYTDMRLEAFSDKLFTKQYLKKLKY